MWWLVEKNGTYGASGVVWCQLIFLLFFLVEVMCMGWSVREGIWSCAYILKGFQIFYLVGCFVMGRLWWLILREGKGGIFLMFCYRQVLVLVSPRWLLERCLCLLGAMCTTIRRCWVSSFCLWKKVYVCKFSVLWCSSIAPM